MNNRPKLTHLNEKGALHMVDVADKPATTRTAIAEGRIVMKPETLALILSGNAKKGDVLGAARIAGIMAAKKTPELIPLCHPLPLSKIEVEITPDPAGAALIVRALVKTTAQSGVEMEALSAVAAACLTLYDMAKSADRAMRIENIHLLEKSGGRSGTYALAASKAP